LTGDICDVTDSDEIRGGLEEGREGREELEGWNDEIRERSQDESMTPTSPPHA
jgi:type VI protein secretion system component Hcp